jgi:hypothetical protein
MPTPFPDPFLNSDEKWETYELTSEDQDLSQPDLTSRNLGDFLRSLEPRLPQPPTPTRDDSRVLPHIHGFPS